MTNETIFNEFKNQGFPLDQTGKICIDGHTFNFMPVIEPWTSGRISKLFGNVELWMDEKLLVSQLIDATIKEKK